MKLNIFILVLSIISFAASSNGQEIKSKSKCYLINILINSEQRWMTLPRNSNDSTVNILDPDHLLDTCNFTTWRGFKINIIKSGGIIDSIKHADFHYLTRQKPDNYYAIWDYKQKEYRDLIFQHGASNTFVTATLKKKGKWYYMGKIKAGVE